MIVLSIFRNASRTIDQFASQIKELRNNVDALVIVAEGDSSDNSYEKLLSHEFLTLKVEHGGPGFGSVDHPVRWRQIAAVCNVVLAAGVRELNARGREEPVVYVEQDLVWDVPTMLALCEHTEKVAAVAPMSMQAGRFYDIWGYTRSGMRFNPYPPIHPALSTTPHGELVEIDTCGSCIAMSPAAARVAQFSPVDCIRGVGRSIQAAGMSLWLDPLLKVEHPEVPR